ncbi:hypothetical protein WJS89_10370 [Sphingomicrobium sp. XHP0235]|uniref:hypothetical protein n=1 Tax=Sphingomicrobium aquimarinum TaxID=3133971 RepID=UPI0031FE6A03
MPTEPITMTPEQKQAKAAEYADKRGWAKYTDSWMRNKAEAFDVLDKLFPDPTPDSETRHGDLISDALEETGLMVSHGWWSHMGEPERKAFLAAHTERFLAKTDPVLVEVMEALSGLYPPNCGDRCPSHPHRKAPTMTNERDGLVLDRMFPECPYPHDHLLHDAWCEGYSAANKRAVEASTKMLDALADAKVERDEAIARAEKVEELV